MSEKRLREIYCDASKCSLEQFQQKVFWRCLYPHARPLARIIWWFNRGFFERDLELVKVAGATRSFEQLAAEISAFGYARHIGGFWRKVARVRLSRQRLLELGTEMFTQGQNEERESPLQMATAGASR